MAKNLAVISVAQSSRRVLQLSSLEYASRQSAYRRMSMAKSIQPTTYTSPIVAQTFSTVRRVFIIALALLVTLFYPIGISVVYADSELTNPAPVTEATDETSTTAEPQSPVVEEPSPATASTATEAPIVAPAESESTSTVGPQQPTGADSSKYTYNEDSGLWESDKYAWDPNTKQTKPLQEQSYSYNPDSGMWDTTEWVYDAPTGSYKPYAKTVAQAPSSVSGETSTTGAFDLFYNNQISNGIFTQSLTGDATVSGNTTGGSAATGNALAMANIINLLNASSSFDGTIATFSSNIYGDVVGDLLIDPAALAALQPAGSQQLANGNATLGVELNQNNQIQNDVDLLAQSGDASVTGNTTGGSAATGNAHAVANVVNMLNSVIGSGQSFVGALNIYGNLNGDILFPPEVLDTLLASNTPKVNLSSQNIQNAEVLTEFTDTQTIRNNVHATAESGDASVTGNTTGGSATSGNALTNINIINLTGKQVIAANSLLVFVNVMGEWVGVIMDAPVGSTAGMLGTGVSQNTTNLAADYAASVNNDITNNINVHAQSGDAQVSNNTTGGNATSGNATASVNIANLINSTFSLSDWFGLLFINVFGGWNGSVGVDTAAGTVPLLPVAPKVGLPKGTTVRKEDIKVFRFVPTNSGSNRLEPLYSGESGPSESTPSAKTTSPDMQNTVLGAATEEALAEDIAAARQVDYWLPLFGFMFGSSLLGVERATSNRNRRRAMQK
jgi:hypothetical protein